MTSSPTSPGDGDDVKTIGLLGGMSWESSIEYERLINEGVRARLGGTHSADLVIRSYDFARVEELQAQGNWDAAAELLATDAVMLERAGATVIALCTNTMHRVADRIEASIAGDFVHLADATAHAVRGAGVDTVGLLGTRYTMEHDFYRGRLREHGLDVVVPDEPDRTTVHDVIYEELVRGEIRRESKDAYLAVIDRLIARGVTGVVAGCTEIELLVTPDDVPVALFPTTAIHAAAIVEASLG